MEAVWDFSSLSLVLALCVVAFAGYILYSVLSNAFLSSLSHVPGPRIAAASDLYFIFWNLVKRQAFLQFSHLHQQYGPVVRVAPGLVVVQGPKYLQDIYGQKLDKTLAAAGFTTNQGTPNAFSAVLSEEATGKRRGMLPHYATSALIPWHDVFHEHSKELLHVLREKSMAGSIDALSILAHTLLDILAEIIFNDSAGVLQDWSEGRHSSVVQAVKDWPRRGAYMSRLPGPVWWLLSKLPIQAWQDIVNSDLTLTQYARPHAARARNEVAAGAVPERQCLAHRLSTVKNSVTNQPWEHAHVVSECIDGFLAGTETTSTVMAYGLWTLARYPLIQKRLQEELDASMSHPGELLPLQVLTQLPYLNAVVKETLRLYAPSVGPTPRIVPKGGMECFGVYLPPGTAVTAQIWDCHRDVESFGADVLEYKPERWFNETQAMKAAFNPFSIGSRNCPGQNLALMDIRIIMSILIRNFVVSVPPETTEETMAPRELTTLDPAGRRCDLIFQSRS